MMEDLNYFMENFSDFIIGHTRLIAVFSLVWGFFIFGKAYGEKMLRFVESFIDCIIEIPEVIIEELINIKKKKKKIELVSEQKTTISLSKTIKCDDDLKKYYDYDVRS